MLHLNIVFGTVFELILIQRVAKTRAGIRLDHKSQTTKADGQDKEVSKMVVRKEATINVWELVAQLAVITAIVSAVAIS